MLVSFCETKKLLEKWSLGFSVKAEILCVNKNTSLKSNRLHFQLIWFQHIHHIHCPFHREKLYAPSLQSGYFLFYFFLTYSPMFFSADEPLFSNHFQV